MKQDVNVFRTSGPVYLLDSRSPWSHSDCKRAAMACLVEAVYTLEKDRRREKVGLKPLAPDWWVPFKYKLVKPILDGEKGDQIVGAVFKWSRRLSILRPGAAPKVVIAFRGTIPRRDTFISDLTADLHMMMLKLHTTDRYSVALKEIEDAVAQYGVDDVCITGHSLGSAVCLMAGRDLAQRGIFIDAHLFNPPFPSLSSENSIWKFLHDFVLEILAAPSDEDKQMEEMDTAFMALKKWKPDLYVNSHDPICSSYMAYFNNRREIDSSSTLKELEASHSWRALLRFVFGECKPFHLIPCFHLHVVKAGSKKFMNPHGLKKWWLKEIEIEIQDTAS